MPHPQQPLTLPYPKSHDFNPRPVMLFLLSPSTPRSSKWSFSFRFPHQNPLCTSPLLQACVKDQPITSLYLTTTEQLGAPVVKLSLSHFLHSPVLPPLRPKYLPLHSTGEHRRLAPLVTWQAKFHTNVLV